MQSLIEVIEQDKKRQMEEFGKAYRQEHITMYQENPLSTPRKPTHDRPRYGLRVMTETMHEVDLSD